MQLTRISLDFVCAWLVAASAVASTWSVPGSFQTIQAAIDAAADGDRIEVAPGSYRQAIDFHGKRLQLLGIQGAEHTILDATGLGTVVTIANGEPQGTLIRGFTIRSSDLADGQRVVDVRGGSDVAIAECAFSGIAYSAPDCLTITGGIVFDVDSAALELAHCTVADNDFTVACSKSFLYGSVLRCRNGSLRVVGSEIARNRVHGAVTLVESAINLDRSTGEFDDCVIDDNDRGSFTIRFSDVALRHSQVTRTRAGDAFRVLGYPEHVLDLQYCVIADTEGVGLRLGQVSLSTAVVRHCTFANQAVGTTPKPDIELSLWNGVLFLENSILWSGGIASSNSGQHVLASHSNVKGNFAADQLEHVFSADPGFKDPTAGDYSLLPGSPCIDSGNPFSPEDADGTLPDIGALPYQPWTEIEAGESGAWHGLGTLIPNSEFALEWSGGPPSAPFALVAGSKLDPYRLPHGMLLPSPAFVSLAVTDPQGSVRVAARWPVNAAPGDTIVIQSLILSSTSSSVVSVSDALVGVGR